MNTWVLVILLLTPYEPPIVIPADSYDSCQQKMDILMRDAQKKHPVEFRGIKSYCFPLVRP